ncbi:hypothetical protein ACFXG4_31595 [Nocardia sp. NPDC059246]|uniref:hypothetical protein n=1 Tax=unclassified Nocardia TaxID=2637762 RepID=UPI0036925601
MAAGKHRALNPHRNKVGNVVAAGAVPLILAIVGPGTANAAPAEVAPMTQQDDAPRAQWPAADAPNVNPYEGLHIPGDIKSSIQWSSQAPDTSYLAPVGVLHPPARIPVSANAADARVVPGPDGPGHAGAAVGAFIAFNAQPRVVGD